MTGGCVSQQKRCSGGCMLAPGCELLPRTPEENVWAMMQAVSDFGWYKFEYSILCNNRVHANCFINPGSHRTILGKMSIRIIATASQERKGRAPR